MAIVAEIDGADPRTQKSLVRALYLVLGFTRDPRTIEWLRAKLDGPHASFVQEYWLSAWRMAAASPDGVKWLDGADDWAAFLVYMFERSPDLEGTSRLLDVAPCFASHPAVVAYYERLLKNPGLPPGEVLQLGAIMRLHGMSVDEDRLCTAMDSVYENSGAMSFVGWPPFVPSEKVVPWLISIPDKAISEDDWKRVEDALVRHTFASGVNGRAAWRAWYEKHKHEGREAWLKAEFEKVDALFPEHVEEAALLLSAHRGLWFSEPQLLPFLKKWAAYKALHPLLVHFLCATRFGFRFRADLQPLVDDILRCSRDQLSGDQLRMLRTCGFDTGVPQSWEDFVREATHRVKR